MRLLEQKKKQPKTQASSNPPRSNIASAGPNDFIPFLQRTLGNRAVHRTLTGTEGLKGKKEKIDSNPLTSATAAPIQRQPGATQLSAQSAVKEEDKKAELRFRGRMSIESRQSRVNRSTFPLEEGYAGIEIRWAVQNIGWQTAPEHIDMVTIYNANRCSGCRKPNDEVFSMPFTADPILSDKQLSDKQPEKVSDKQPKTDNYEGTVFTLMNFPAGHYDVYIDIDFYDEVEEMIKENNTTDESFYVRPRKKSGPDVDDD